jgi:hypothetical protein
MAVLVRVGRFQMLPLDLQMASLVVLDVLDLHILRIFFATERLPTLDLVHAKVLLSYELLPKSFL